MDTHTFSSQPKELKFLIKRGRYQDIKSLYENGK